MTRENFQKPVRDIMQRDTEWENSLNQTDRLALACLRMRNFMWDKDALGTPPRKIGFDNRKAIENIVGVAEVSRFEKMEVCGWTYDEWLHWYTVERVNEEREKENRRFEQTKKENRVKDAIMLMALASIVAVLLFLSKVALDLL